MSDFEQHVAESLGRIEAKVDGLAGENGRITKIEEELNRNWWYTAAVVPATALLNVVIRKIGGGGH